MRAARIGILVWVTVTGLSACDDDGGGTANQGDADAGEGDGGSDSSFDLGEDTGADTGEDTGADTGGDVGEDTGEDIGEDIGEDVAEDTAEDTEDVAEDLTDARDTVEFVCPEVGVFPQLPDPQPYELPVANPEGFCEFTIDRGARHEIRTQEYNLNGDVIRIEQDNDYVDDPGVDYIEDRFYDELTGLLEMIHIDDGVEYVGGGPSPAGGDGEHEIEIDVTHDECQFVYTRTYWPIHSSGGDVPLRNDDPAGSTTQTIDYADDGTILGVVRELEGIGVLDSGRVDEAWTYDEAGHIIGYSATEAGDSVLSDTYTWEGDDLVERSAQYDGADPVVTTYSYNEDGTLATVEVEDAEADCNLDLSGVQTLLGFIGYGADGATDIQVTCNDDNIGTDDANMRLETLEYAGGDLAQVHVDDQAPIGGVNSWNKRVRIDTDLFELDYVGTNLGGAASTADDTDFDDSYSDHTYDDEGRLVRINGILGVPFDSYFDYVCP